MLKILYKSYILLVLCVLTLGTLLTSCKKDNDETPGSEPQLLSFGPSPALRGGELKFIGHNLDQVTAVMLPGDIEVTTFKTKTPSLLVIDVPQATVPGSVSLKTTNGVITAKSSLTISEPISIASVSPAKARPGDVITIKGTYLTLIEEVIFADNKPVSSFESRSKDSIQVRVPESAQTGLVVVSNGAEEPILVSSAAELEVTLPSISSMAPNPVKAGSTIIISGADLDLTKEIVFGGNRKVTEFELSQAGDQLTVSVPENAEDGKIKLVAASLVEIESAQGVIMVVPTLTEITPNPAKNDSIITVKGANLDLVTGVTFGGAVAGSIELKSAAELTVKVPTEARDSVVTFHTAANKKVVSGTALTLVKPTITSIAPTEVKTLENITISGTNLDLVVKVRFNGGIEGKIVSSFATEMVVTVPTRSLSGVVTLIPTNGVEVASSQSLSIEPGNVPTVTSVPDTVKPGQMIVIEGLKLDLATEVIFPGNVKATQFGSKTATRLEVLVPEKTAIGLGRIKFVTAHGDEYESPQIRVEGSIKYYIYNEALNSAWQQWNGWGLESQDWGNTEQAKAGSKSIKVVAKADNWGAIQAHPANTFNTSNYEVLILSVYGAQAGKVAVQIKDDAGKEHGDYPIDLVAGQWVTVEIPISALGNPATINEFRVKSSQGPAQTFYLDEIGFR
jgi:hypothetical protein